MVLGKDGASAFLKRLLDSQAGINLGKLVYHHHIAKQYTHLTVHYTNFDTQKFDPMLIGGIDGAGMGAPILLHA